MFQYIFQNINIFNSFLFILFHLIKTLRRCSRFQKCIQAVCRSGSSRSHPSPRRRCGHVHLVTQIDPTTHSRCTRCRYRRYLYWCFSEVIITSSARTGNHLSHFFLSTWALLMSKNLPCRDASFPSIAGIPAFSYFSKRNPALCLLSSRINHLYRVRSVSLGYQDILAFSFFMPSGVIHLDISPTVGIRSLR